MLALTRTWKLLSVGMLVALFATRVSASGAVGDHVNALSEHVDEYTEEVVWLIGKIDGIISTYETKGSAAAGTDAIVDHWEAVDFHSAIETHYIPLYASIWQGLFAVKTAIDEGKPEADVRATQASLESVLWQSLGAVKVAAQYQERGLLPEYTATSVDSPTETIDVIKQRLDRVLAKYAEQLPEQARNIATAAYAEQFESIEDEIEKRDAELTEDLEVDFNVRLPEAIDAGVSVDALRDLVLAMQAKLNQAKTLLSE